MHASKLWPDKDETKVCKRESRDHRIAVRPRKREDSAKPKDARGMAMPVCSTTSASTAGSSVVGSGAAAASGGTECSVPTVVPSVEA